MQEPPVSLHFTHLDTTESSRSSHQTLGSSSQTSSNSASHIRIQPQRARASWGLNPTPVHKRPHGPFPFYKLCCLFLCCFNEADTRKEYLILTWLGQESGEMKTGKTLPGHWQAKHFKPGLFLCWFDQFTGVTCVFLFLCFSQTLILPGIHEAKIHCAALV